MNGQEKVLTALDRREPDRVPYDLARTQVTGTAIEAYANLRRHLHPRDGGYRGHA